MRIMEKKMETTIVYFARFFWSLYRRIATRVLQSNVGTVAFEIQLAGIMHRNNKSLLRTFIILNMSSLPGPGSLRNAQS